MSEIDWSTVTDRDLIAEARKRIDAGDIDGDDLGIESECDCDYLGQFSDAGGGIDMYLVDEARSRFMRREYREALWNIEKALGNDFAGLSEIVPEGGK